MICPNPECPDLELFGVRGEYVDGTTMCPKCGVWLVDEDPPRAGRDETGDVLPADWRDPHREASGGDLVQVVGFNYRHEAELARSYLEAHGIPALVSSDDCGAVDPILGAIREVTVSVLRQDVLAADDLLDDLEASSSDDESGFEDELDGRDDVEGGWLNDSAEDIPVDDRANADATELAAGARRAVRTLVVGLVVLPWIVLPIAVVQSLTVLWKGRAFDGEAPALRLKMAAVAFAAIVADAVWIWIAQQMIG